jgi:hypothetical protein
LIDLRHRISIEQIKRGQIHNIVTTVHTCIESQLNNRSNSQHCNYIAYMQRSKSLSPSSRGPVGLSWEKGRGVGGIYTRVPPAAAGWGNSVATHGVSGGDAGPASCTRFLYSCYQCYRPLYHSVLSLMFHYTKQALFRWPKYILVVFFKTVEN